MSVPETKRGEGKFNVLVKAQELATYTLQITGNTRVFKPEYAYITNKLNGYATDIFTKCWTANNILVRDDAYKAKRRIELEESAAMDCNLLLATIQIAQPIFHLKSKRVGYWGDKTVDVRKLIREWIDSERKRYSALLK